MVSVPLPAGRFEQISQNLHRLIFWFFTRSAFQLSASAFLRERNNDSELFKSFFEKPTGSEEVIQIGSIAEIERDVGNWRMTCVDLKEIAKGWYLLKELRGKDEKRWIFVNVRSELGCKIGIFEKKRISMWEYEEKKMSGKVGNAWKKACVRSLKGKKMLEGDERVVVDVSPELNKVVTAELEKCEKEEGVEASNAQIKAKRESVVDAFEREVRDTANLEMVSCAHDPAIKDCKIKVVLTELIIYACLKVTKENKCHVPENMGKLVGLVNDVVRFNKHVQMSEWCRWLRRRMPEGQKELCVDINVGEHGLRSKTAKLSLNLRVCGRNVEAPELPRLRQLISSSAEIHTTRQALAVVDREFEERAKAFGLGVTQLRVAGMIGLGALEREVNK